LATFACDVASKFFAPARTRQNFSQRSWKFWFLSNTFLALIVTLVLGAVFLFGFTKFQAEFLFNFPDEAVIEMKDGKLSTQNLGEPLKLGVSDEGMVVLDTDQRMTEEDLAALDNLVLITGDKFLARERGEGGLLQTKEYFWTELGARFFSYHWSVDIKNLDS
jgi:hypothetical protein